MLTRSWLLWYLDIIWCLIRMRIERPAPGLCTHNVQFFQMHIATLPVKSLFSVHIIKNMRLLFTNETGRAPWSWPLSLRNLHNSWKRIITLGFLHVSVIAFPRCSNHEEVFFSISDAFSSLYFLSKYFTLEFKQVSAPPKRYWPFKIWFPGWGSIGR